jgi:hypothetical protein
MERYEKLENGVFHILARGENWVHARIRHPSFRKKLFVGALVVTFAFQAAYPLVITGATSLKEAGEVCDRRLRKPAAWSRRDKTNGLTKDLHLTNLFGTAQLAVTTACVLLWFFFSPHYQPQAADLDKASKNTSLHFITTHISKHH